MLLLIKNLKVKNSLKENVSNVIFYRHKSSDCQKTSSSKCWIEWKLSKINGFKPKQLKKIKLM